MNTPSPSPSPLSSAALISINSPDFQFWNDPNSLPSASPLHSADQLFSHGFLLPLRSLPQPASLHPSAHIMSDLHSNNENPILSASKRWKQIFKRNTTPEDINCKREKLDTKRVKDRKSGNRPRSAELNINIWPFSRSRSAGNNSTRSTNSNRKVSSAPCSRSNSSGDSKLSRRSFPGSPTRAGVHVGRASPVWQLKRPAPARGKVNAPPCVGSRQGLSCRSNDNGSGAVKTGGNLFGFRGLFTKKTNTPAVLTA